MPKARRSFFQRLAGWGAAAASGARLEAQRAPVPVETPDVPKLPWKMVDGVKEFHLVAEPVHKDLMPGRPVDVWGFNGSMPGPTIEVNQGDRVRIVFENKLPEISAVHWHGLEVPIAMDGVPGISMDPVPPGGTFTYEFTVHQHGSFFYHSHMPMQEMFGMIGWFIIHPEQDYEPHVDRDYAYVLQEWALLPNNTVPNTLSMEFNWLTMNGKAGPDITPVLCKPGERVRLRFVNMGMDHHPMHMHGHQWVTTGTEGGRIPEAAWQPGNTQLVGVAQVRTVEFVAKYVGDWMLHCHLPHHMMNQMVSMVGPMTHGGGGMQAGLGMEEGMGIIRGGGAMGEANGPALGRGLGMAADHERASSAFVHQQHGDAAEGAERVPGFPQDMWMPMDHLVDHKPENYGLRKEWTASMMGMMTLIRVLEPEMFDKIAELKRQQVRA
ncbi:MAG: copper oxidase [Bryobacterales bacterium]|nr:copper oxidase [Bryobacterales bacterium]